MSEGNKAARNAGGFQFRVRGPREFYGGLVMIGIAILAMWASRNLPGQQGFAFGPGTAPRLFATLLALMGGAVALSGLFVDGPKIDRFSVRGPVLITLAIVLFALFIRGASLEYLHIPVTLPSLGLIPSTFIAFLVAIMATPEMRWVESLLAAAGMTVFCTLLFVYALGLPFQLWPSFFM